MFYHQFILRSFPLCSSLELLPIFLWKLPVHLVVGLCNEGPGYDLISMSTVCKTVIIHTVFFLLLFSSFHNKTMCSCCTHLCMLREAAFLVLWETGQAVTVTI